MKTDKKAGKIPVLLNRVARRVKYSPGCQQCDIWFNEDHTEYMLYETWRAMADPENHIHSPL